MSQQQRQADAAASVHHRLRMLEKIVQRTTELLDDGVPVAEIEERLTIALYILDRRGRELVEANTDDTDTDTGATPC